MKHALAVLAVAALAACAPTPPPAAPAADAASTLACSAYWSLADDASTMTDDELRDEVKAMDSHGSVAAIDAVKDSSHAMLKAISTGTVEEYATAAQGMVAACNAALL